LTANGRGFTQIYTEFIFQKDFFAALRLCGFAALRLCVPIMLLILLVQLNLLFFI